MSVSAAQQRVLEGIADGLRRTEPKLAAMYAMFTRLSGNEEPPSRERLAPRRSRALVAALVTLWPGHRTQFRRGKRRFMLIASQFAAAIALASVLVGLGWQPPAGCGRAGHQRSAAHARLWCPQLGTAGALAGK
jgi:hypothetical protein